MRKVRSFIKSVRSTGSVTRGVEVSVRSAGAVTQPGVPLRSALLATQSIAKPVRSALSVARAAIVLVFLMVAAAMFSVGLLLPSAAETAQNLALVSAGTRFSPDFEKRFAYIEPVWDTAQWYAKREKGAFKLSSSREQYFSLQSKFFDKADGSDISGASAPEVLSVFSSLDMNDIASGQAKVAVASGQAYSAKDDNAAFVLLDNNDASYNNRVALEFTNLTSITNFDASYNGMSFVRRSLSDQNNISDIGGAFVSIDGNVDLQNPALFEKDLTNPNVPDKIFWGRASNGEFQIRGMFNREGYYQFRFDVAVWGTSADRRVTLQFGFYIGHASKYMNVEGASQKNMPVFDLNLDKHDTVNGQGRPVMQGLMRPSYSTSVDEDGNYYPINNDRFFYNYQNSFPSIEYSADRYAVAVAMTDHNKVPRTVTKGGTSTYPVFTFNQLGMYQIDAEMRFPVSIVTGYSQGIPQYESRVVSIPNFAAHRYFLDIFGFQAQYWDFETESYKWFAGTDDRNSPSKFVNSDITNYKGEEVIGTYTSFGASYLALFEAFVPDIVVEPFVDECIDLAGRLSAAASYADLRAVVEVANFTSISGVDGSGFAEFEGFKTVRDGFIDVISKLGAEDLRDFKNDADFAINKTSTATKIASADSAIRSLVGKLGGIVPVVTNSPPVSLRYNVSHAYADIKAEHILSRVAYRKNSSAEWSFDTPYGSKLFAEYLVGRPFEIAGEYAVIVYYEYNAAEEVGKLYHQIFYFKINDFAAEIMIQARNQEGVIQNYSFADLMGQKLQTSALGVVYKAGGDYINRVGPFEVAPRLELIYSNFAGTQFESIPDYDPAVVPLQALTWYGKDGIYTFRVYYGNNRSVSNMPYMDFSVIVDTTPIQSFQCYLGSDTKNTGLEVRNGAGGALIQNISLFGGGEVNLAWDRKESGVDMLVAKLDFYEFRIGSAFHSDDVEAPILSSQFEIRPAISRSLRILQTESGYRLADKLTASGLYVITILDAAGVETQYLVIIDTTVASIAQDEAVNPNEVNIKKENTSVGFGREKFIVANAGSDEGVKYLAGFFADLQASNPSYLAALLNSGIFVNGTNVGVKIPVATVEMSTNGVDFIPVYDRTRALNQLLVSGNTATRNNYFRELVIETDKSVTYFFRLLDLTGNMATHYVELNPDPTLGIIFEDNVSTIFNSGAISRTATILQNGMISNRDYLTFSFMQATNGDPWRVDQVNIAYYPLTFQREFLKQRVDADGNPVVSGGEPIFDTVENLNYPFSDTPEIFTAYNVGTFEPTSAERLAININRGPLTRQGLYVIARICNNAYGPGVSDIRNYRFIVDNNPTIANKNFETGTRVQFGSGVLSRTATYNDFQRINNAHMDPSRDRVLRANTVATVRLPGSASGVTGSKYGRTYTDSYGITRGNLHNTFTIRTGSLLLSTDTNSVTFSSLNLTKSLQYRAPGSDMFVEQSITQSNALELSIGGMYRVALTDGSGGYSWILGADAPTPPEGNRSELLIEIITQGPQGTFSLNGRQIASSTVDSSGNIHSVKISDKTSDRLTFSYVVEDTSNFLQRVNAPPSRIDLRRASGSISQLSVLERGLDETTNHNNLLSGRALYSQYTVGTVTFCEVTLPLVASSVQNGDTFAVTLNNGAQSRTFELLLDNTPPKFNLNRIVQGDAFFNTGTNWASIITHAGGEATIKADGTVEIGATNSLKYPFRLSNDFRFNKASGIHTFDTYTISYFEVDSRLSNISGERFFDYNKDAFYNVVGMQSNQNRFFRIVERDEAGNRADYFVQLRGDGYVDSIGASGVVEYRTDSFGRLRPTGRQVTGNLISESGVVRGYEMSVENVREFFANNLFFEISTGRNTVRRLGLDVMIVNGYQMKATPEIFASELQNMVLSGQGGGLGGSVEFKLDNRFKSFAWEVRQITRNTGTIEISAESSLSLNDIRFSVNDSAYPFGLADGSGFIFEVYNLSDLSAGPITSKTSLWTRSVYVDDKNQEYLIVVTDEFGRVIRYAHNGLYGSRIELKYDDGMSDYIGEDLYVGSGVEAVYSANAYDFEIYQNGVLVFRNGSLLNTDLAKYVIYTAATASNYDAGVRLMPEEGKITQWSVVAYRRGTGVKWESVFFLYGELPILLFTNQSGEALVGLENSGVTSGIVTVSYSLEGLLFGASVEYTRTWTDANGNLRVDWFPISEFMTRFNLTHEGQYSFTVTNALGFTSNPSHYIFTIDDVSNRHYKVSFDYGNVDEEGNKLYDELEASPVLYSFDHDNNPSTVALSIPNFFIRDVDGLGNTDVIKNCVSDRNENDDDVDVPLLRIVPTTNSRREIWGSGTLGQGGTAVRNRFFVEDIATNTYIYRLVSPTTKTEIYLAVTLVAAHSTVFEDGVGYIENTTSSGVSFVWEHESSMQLERAPTSVLRTYYQPLYRPNATISVGLNRDALSNAGNVLYVDYFRDGSTEPLGRLRGTQRLTILARDYGTYTFRVSDHAGNVRRFSYTDGTNTVSANHYTLVNLSRAPLYINETNAQGPVPIVDGLVYSDSISLVVGMLPFGISNGQDVFATKLDVYHNNTLRRNLGGEAASKDQERTSFPLSEPGSYKVVLTYRIVGFLTTLITSEYNFVIVSSIQARQNFSFVAPLDTEITSIKLNGNEIRTRFSDDFLRQINLSSATGTGEYLITLRFGTDNIHQKIRSKTFAVIIRSLPRVDVFATVDYGKSTTGEVGISVNPRALFTAYDNCRVLIVLDEEILSDVVIGTVGEIPLENEQVAIADVSTAGQYMIYVTSIDSTFEGGTVKGIVYYSQGFQITEAQNPLGTIIIIVIIVLLVAVVLVFIRLRTRMRVR